MCIRDRVKVYDSSWNPICETEERLNVTGTGIVDGGEDRDNLTIAPNTGIQQSLPLSAITLFPNPATNEVNLMLADFMGMEMEIAIINNIGQSVYQHHLQAVANRQFTINSSNFTNGFYIVRIKLDGQRIINKKLMIKHLY